MNKPAIHFHFPNHENFFHYVHDAAMLVFDTLNDTGLMPPAVTRRGSLRCTGAPSEQC